MRRGLLALVAASAAAALIFGVGAASSAGGGGVSYIVRLAEDPAATYEGGVAGYAATAPAKGQKLDATSQKVKDYVAYLNKRHADVAGNVGASKFYDYSYSFNGFAAELNRAQAAALEKTTGVVSVEKDVLAHIDTDNTPRFLGLAAPGNGIWTIGGGQAKAGEGVVVGIVDTGFWPEHPSFSDQPDLSFKTGSTGAATSVYGPPPATWHGTCQSGEQWSQDFCTNKLIGARYFLSGYGHFGVVKNDYKSARDADGHGTHTGSTAAGNANVPASILGSNLGKVSGMAPRARVAIYKVCWNGEEGGCPNSDTVAAIDAAVADGVDVINFSISGTSTNYLDAVEVSFLFARRAGVFVATSAGNSGPGASTVAHISPWLISTAASTQDRSFVGTAIVGGTTYNGVTLTGGVGPAPLVDAASLGDPLCHTGSLAAATGKVVLCLRGDNPRVDKSLAVKTAGGVGMILYNPNDAQALVTDNHHVPSVHINFTDGSAIKAYIASHVGTATATITAGHAVYGGGNVMADFSSRGPSIAGAGDILKPDITAPGVNVLAGNTPTAFLGAPGQLFQSISGTSMSSPHVAGLGALLTWLHPSWSPAAMQSALMTSARQNLTKEDGSTPADPFDFGAGHVVPNGAADPGLVYDAGINDYRNFLKGQGLCNFCFGTTLATAIKASDLNLASLAVGKLAGKATLTRTVTNVSSATGKYKLAVSAPAGIAVDVNPTSLTLAPGASQTFTVTLTATASAQMNAYAFGSLTWSDRDGHSVRSPIVVKPVPIAAPGEVTGSGVTGSAAVPVTFGYSGTLTTQPQGLVAAVTAARTVGDDPTNDFNTADPAGNQGITVHSFDVAPGTAVARFQTFGTGNGSDDLDMYVYSVSGSTRTLVGTSGGGTAAEVVTVQKPAGKYEVYIHGWEVSAPAAYTLYSWVVPAAPPAGNLTSTPSQSATVGASGTVSVGWSGLVAGTRYMGRIAYSNGSSEIGGTIVRVDA
jgi:hypothetical protein